MVLKPLASSSEVSDERTLASLSLNFRKSSFARWASLTACPLVQFFFTYLILYHWRAEIYICDSYLLEVLNRVQGMPQYINLPRFSKSRRPRLGTLIIINVSSRKACPHFFLPLPGHMCIFTCISGEGHDLLRGSLSNT